MAATRETVTIPGPTDYLAVLTQDGMVERYELDRLKSLCAALLALHAPRLVDHLMSGIPGDQYNCPGQPPEHFACHFLYPLPVLDRSSEQSVSPAIYTVCYLARQSRTAHSCGQNCSYWLMEGNTTVGLVENYEGSDMERGWG